MKLLFISGRENTYTRNSVILKGFRDNNVEVLECTSSSKSYPLRYLISFGKFLLKRKEAHDAIFIGFFGQPLVPIIKKLSNKPIILDAFLSSYDTMCFDRKKCKPDSIGGKFFYWLDKHSCELSDKILLDTDAHIDYFVNTFGLSRGKFERIFVGADNSMFYPRPEITPEHNNNEHKFSVFYYGSYLPLQGIEYIIQAAKNLEAYKDIQFTIVGNGMEHEKILALANKLEVKNINFIDWVPYEKLPLEIAKADICLGGHFSDIEKGKRVIAGKTFQFIAMKKPVIVGDNTANRELFENRVNALLVEHANPEALAAAILELRNNEPLRHRLAEEGAKTFHERCTLEVIGKQITEILKEVRPS